MNINLYGILIALGVAAAVIYMGKEAKRLSLPSDLAVDMALWSVPIAVLSSRIYYVIFTWDHYKDDWLSIFKVWEGGLAIYGGVIGGALGIYLLSRYKKLPYLKLLDLVAPGLILGQAIGRWGNFFNKEAFGELITNPAHQFFPLAVLVDGQWHQATFFYESVCNLLGFFFLLFVRDRCYKKGHGFVLQWYFIFYGLVRVVIEGLRTDSLMLGSLRVSQVLSILLVAASGIILMLRLKRRPLVVAGAVIWTALFAVIAVGVVRGIVLTYAVMAAFALMVFILFMRETAKGSTA